MSKQNKIIMKLDLETLRATMPTNGYCHFDKDAYLKKDDTPCFIAENSDEPRSWISLFKETLETIKTRDFLMAVLENYDVDEEDDIYLDLETCSDHDIMYDEIYKDITNETPEEWAEGFMDSYFLGGDEIWCHLSTKLADYTN